MWTVVWQVGCNWRESKHRGLLKWPMLANVLATAQNEGVKEVLRSHNITYHTPLSLKQWLTQTTKLLLLKQLDDNHIFYRIHAQMVLRWQNNMFELYEPTKRGEPN